MLVGRRCTVAPFGGSRTQESSTQKEKSGEHHATGHRRVPGEGQDDLGLPRPGVRRGGELRPRPRSAPQRGRRAGQIQGDSPGRGSGVDVDNDFAALYVVSADRRQQIAKLKKLTGEVDEILLATDEDREGEAIAWHLVETLKPRVPVKRMVFHEITKPAIQAAVANPRDIDRDLVDAQEARRILDRLYGYEVSPVLWKKVMPKLSAGRVQSVATRIVVERERQRMKFRSAEYWDVAALLAVDAGQDR